MTPDTTTDDVTAALLYSLVIVVAFGAVAFLINFIMGQALNLERVHTNENR